jgi:hypothetical protein
MTKRKGTNDIHKKTLNSFLSTEIITRIPWKSVSWFGINTTGITSGAETAYPSGAPLLKNGVHVD